MTYSFCFEIIPGSQNFVHLGLLLCQELPRTCQYIDLFDLSCMPKLQNSDVNSYVINMYDVWFVYGLSDLLPELCAAL